MQSYLDARILPCKQERGNPEDLYAVSVMNDDTQSHVARSYPIAQGVIICSASASVPVSGHVRLGDT